jgi:hypothetical protein
MLVLLVSKTRALLPKGGRFQPEWPEALKEPPSWGAFGVAFSPRLPAPYWVHRQSLAKIKTNSPPICRLLLSTRAPRGSQVVARDFRSL